MSQVHKDLQFVACAFCYKHYRLQQQSHPAIHNERRRQPGAGHFQTRNRSDAL